MEEWIKKVQTVFEEYDKDNPTSNSVIYMLNRMTKEYFEYKKLGTIDELKKLKNKID